MTQLPKLLACESRSLSLSNNTIRKMLRELTDDKLVYLQKNSVKQSFIYKKTALDR